MKKTVDIRNDIYGKEIVMIDNILFKGKNNIDWGGVKEYLKSYVHKNRNAMNGWYRYDSRFALPVYLNNNKTNKFNAFHASMIVRHSEDGKKYLYDIIDIKKETGNPLGF